MLRALLAQQHSRRVLSGAAQQCVAWGAGVRACRCHRHRGRPGSPRECNHLRCSFPQCAPLRLHPPPSPPPLTHTPCCQVVSRWGGPVSHSLCGHECLAHHTQYRFQSAMSAPTEFFSTRRLCTALAASMLVRPKRTSKAAHCIPTADHLSSLLMPGCSCQMRRGSCASAAVQGTRVCPHLTHAEILSARWLLRSM